MTNPVGFAYLPGGVLGLQDDGLTVGGADPTIAALRGDADPDYFCHGVGLWVNLRFDFTYTSAVPTVKAASLAGAGVEFCTIHVRWNQSSLGSGAAFGSCPPVADPAVMNMTVAMAGFGTLRLGTVFNTEPNPGSTGSRTALGADSVTGIDTGVLPASFPAPYTMWTPQGFLLRPTPLTWPGQDPDNVGNRAIWHTSEVGDVTYAASAIGVATPPGFGLIMNPAWTLGPKQRGSFPSACPITPLPAPPPPPAELHAGDQMQGLRPRGRSRAA